MSLQAAKDRVTEALKEYGQPGRTIVEVSKVIDDLLDVQQYLAAVVDIAATKSWAEAYAEEPAVSA